MDTNREFSAEEIARIKQEAIVEAHRLRHEAIDDFWRGINGILSTAAVQSYRSAQRLASRLRRRARHDDSPGPTSSDRPPRT